MRRYKARRKRGYTEDVRTRLYPSFCGLCLPMRRILGKKMHRGPIAKADASCTLSWIPATVQCGGHDPDAMNASSIIPAMSGIRDPRADVFSKTSLGVRYPRAQCGRTSL